MKQNVLVVGAGGQLGRELQRTVPPGVDCAAVTRAQLDIADAKAVDACLQSVAPQLVINAAAYTAVDKAESEPEAAHRGNAEGPGVLAEACARQGIRLSHVSTDFVFDGNASTPYRPDATTAPLGVYGHSKLAGEEAVFRAQPQALVVRTGWVYSSVGGNFVKTMLRLMGERDELGVVCDQVGTPTWANGLATALWAAAAKPDLAGIYHWSDAGVCSWYDFAVAICEEGVFSGLLPAAISVKPILAAAYPTPARRPSYSVLDKTSSWRDFELEGVHWREQLRTMLNDLKELGNG